MFAHAEHALGLSFVPRALRHSGPPRDRNRGRLIIEEIGRHGRCKDVRTVAPCQQSSRTPMLLSDLEPALRQYLLHRATHLASFEKGSSRVSDPPGVGRAASSSTSLAEPEGLLGAPA